MLAGCQTNDTPRPSSIQIRHLVQIVVREDLQGDGRGARSVGIDSNKNLEITESFQEVLSAWSWKGVITITSFIISIINPQFVVGLPWAHPHPPLGNVGNPHQDFNRCGISAANSQTRKYELLGKVGKHSVFFLQNKVAELREEIGIWG